jgi:hypothetical protein
VPPQPAGSAKFPGKRFNAYSQQTANELNPTAYDESSKYPDTEDLYAEAIRPSSLAKVNQRLETKISTPSSFVKGKKNKKQASGSCYLLQSGFLLKLFFRTKEMGDVFR